MTTSRFIKTASITGICTVTTLFACDRWGVATIKTVEGSSMQPTFNPNYGLNAELNKLINSKDSSRVIIKRELRKGWLHDKILINKWIIRDKNNLRVGDVVILASPRDNNKLLIKRITALPGDIVQHLETGDVKIIEDGYCWVEGDNHETSFDSNNFGAVPLYLIKGRVSLIIWPPTRIRTITCDPYITSQSSRTRLVK